MFTLGEKIGFSICMGLLVSILIFLFSVVNNERTTRNKNVVTCTNTGAIIQVIQEDEYCTKNGKILFPF